MFAMDEIPPSTLSARRSTRLSGFDYSSDAAYVVTLCTHNRRPLLGAIVDGEMRRSWIGAIAEREWCKTPAMRRGVMLDEFILMPNHLHGIIILNLPADGPRGREIETSGVRSFQAPSVGLEAIMRGFKSAVTSAVRKERPGMALQVWQRGYYDRIIRDERELERFRQYIACNLLQWELDRYFPAG
jgi:putative transposase